MGGQPARTGQMVRESYSLGVPSGPTIFEPSEERRLEPAARIPEEGNFSMRSAWIALLGIGLMAAAPGAFSHAYSGPAAAPSRTFSTGRVDISTGPNRVLVGLSGMAPGEGIAVPLTISNAGTVPLRYAMTTRIDGSSGLSNGLILTVKRDVVTCSNAGLQRDGTEVYQGPVTDGAIGDPSRGPQAGDRTLDASANEVLCFHVQLPASAADTLQNLTVTATFTFRAE